MKYQGIIFDFNGVLLWDDSLHKEAFVETAIKLRHKPLTDQEIAERVLGRTNKMIFEYLAGRALPDDQVQDLTNRKESVYRRLCLKRPKEFQLSPGAVELFNFLIAKNIPHTIATSSEKTNVGFFVRELNLGKWFDVSNIVYDDGIRSSKPNPDIYLEAAQKINLSPEKCVVVEDATSGVEAAYRADIGIIIALGPKNIHEALLQLPGVSKVIESLKEFPVQLFS